MRVAHRTSRICLGAARGLTEHLRDVILEPCWRYSMVGFVHTRVGIQPWVGHDPVDEVIDDGSDVVDASEPIVEGRFDWALHVLSFPPAGRQPCIAIMTSLVKTWRIRQDLAHPSILVYLP